MEKERINGKLSRKDSVVVTVYTDKNEEICKMIDRSYENLDALIDDSRRKLPSGYSKRMFGVQVVCESRGWQRDYRVPVTKPAKRKR